MSEPDDIQARRPAQAGKPDREARLAQALRANLKRRKQAGRAGAPAAGPETGSDEES
ncbi:MAG: hypothetical protein Q8R97_07175 [Brevundimonas sp.]|uniref:hypothetical protein n=1 Tax=Brevundimonas sp. TaxID=1871086 RepID=UPI0027596412|nr:hypothetical protein [Brevundimonas sp.]MDP3400886.1 hypothetical protein [Brevundimonas sp.]MDZ4112821.1 hypothetical protein [Brevundimonas sp.]